MQDTTGSWNRSRLVADRQLQEEPASQEQEERGSNKNFLGDGQVFWMSDDANVQTVDREKLPEGQTSSAPAPASADVDDFHF